MEQNKLKACPKCKEKLYRNGTRNGKQRWRCSNNECKYTFTENVQISAPKNNAVGFLYNVMKQLSEYSAKLDDDIIQTKIRETKYKSKGNYDTKIAIEYIRNFDGNYTIDANSFIIKIDKNEFKLLCFRYNEKDLLFKREKNKYIIKEYKEIKTNQNYNVNYCGISPIEEDYY